MRSPIYCWNSRTSAISSERAASAISSASFKAPSNSCSVSCLSQLLFCIQSCFSDSFSDGSQSSVRFRSQESAYRMDRASRVLRRHAGSENLTFDFVSGTVARWAKQWALSSVARLISQSESLKQKKAEVFRQRLVNTLVRRLLDAWSSLLHAVLSGAMN